MTDLERIESKLDFILESMGRDMERRPTIDESKYISASGIPVDTIKIKYRRSGLDEWNDYQLSKAMRSEEVKP